MPLYGLLLKDLAGDPPLNLLTGVGDEEFGGGTGNFLPMDSLSAAGGGSLLTPFRCVTGTTAGLRSDIWLLLLDAVDSLLAGLGLAGGVGAAGFNLGTIIVKANEINPINPLLFNTN